MVEGEEVVVRARVLIGDLHSRVAVNTEQILPADLIAA
jgi:hypothetical protein